MYMKNIYFVPFGQDDYAKKPLVHGGKDQMAAGDDRGGTAGKADPAGTAMKKSHQERLT